MLKKQLEKQQDPEKIRTIKKRLRRIDQHVIFNQKDLDPFSIVPQHPLLSSIRRPSSKKQQKQQKQQQQQDKQDQQYQDHVIASSIPQRQYIRRMTTRQGVQLSQLPSRRRPQQKEEQKPLQWSSGGGSASIRRPTQVPSDN